MLRCLWLLLILLPGPTLADTLRLAVGQSLPPYVMPDGSGMELDIVREALALHGHRIELLFLPFQRVIDSVQHGLSDAAMTVNEDSELDAYYSAEHIRYQNVAVALQARQLALQNIADLGSYSLLAFQNARHYLGPEFGKMADHNPDYREIAQQQLQIAMLFGNRVDVIVLDENIFRYFRSRMEHPDTSASVHIFRLFPPTPYKVAFTKAQWRDDFNDGLAQLRASGRYDAIIAHYLNSDTGSAPE